ncbi:hypothetical protein JD969_02695 [Planctomycetota bacterium]|nr:hypothetical protein JD969_02695 [Planctomycetota bacterium]
MPNNLDQTMEQASQALAQTDYLLAESLCLEALAAAKQAEDWNYYARILLPLQEARRQRRIIAADGIIQLGTTKYHGPHLQEWLTQNNAGCIIITSPCKEQDAADLLAQARNQKLHVEVLYAQVDDDNWTIRIPNYPSIEFTTPAPPPAWCNKPIPAAMIPESGHSIYANGPAGLFLYICEQLGNVAIDSLPSDLNHTDRIQALEQHLHAIGDHEFLHQQLTTAAKDAS